MIDQFVEETEWPEGVSVETLDTGEETGTGGRVYLARDLVSSGTFGLTYADGLADIDLDSLLAFHEDGDCLATMTVVRPEIQWGVVDLGEGDRVEGFREKPRSEHWINGGFFFMEPAALDWIGPDSILEEEPIEDLAAAGELRAWRHDGFWDCVDTYKDLISMNDLWQSGESRWLGPS
jgi:glucose-1-phosphate cytidylyltransferase